MASEQTLLERARRFDEQALAEIYDTYSPAIYRYAVRLLGDIDLAEDCVAETFKRFLVSLRQDAGPRQYLQAYLYRVAHNWITDFYRHQQPVSSPLEEDLHADQGPEPFEAAAQAMERQQVRDALAKLTPDQRQVIVLKYLEGCDNEEISRALNKPVGAVKSLQHRALESLRRLLYSKGTNVK